MTPPPPNSSGGLDAQDAEIAEPIVELARRMALLLPVVVDGYDFLGDEVPDRLAEGLVVLGEDATLHGDS